MSQAEAKLQVVATDRLRQEYFPPTFRKRISCWNTLLGGAKTTKTAAKCDAVLGAWKVFGPLSVRTRLFTVN